MTIRGPETQRRLSLYVVPVLIGLGGIIYSQQLDQPFWRMIALVMSIALPLYAAGNLLARFRTSTLERFVMLSGVLMLILGAAFSILGLPETFIMTRYVDETVINASRVIGMLSLFLGLFVVLLSIARTGEGIDEITERFRFLAEHISEGFILSTPDGVIRLVNQKALDLFGVKREDVIGRNARDMAAVFDIDNVVEQLDRRADGVASEYEVVFDVGDDKRILLINGAPVFNQQGQHTLTMATVRDITEHRRLTERVEQYARTLQQQVEEQTKKLHQSEERLRQLLLSMNEGFLTIDLEHKIRFANAQAQSLLKTDETTLTRQHVFDYVAAADRYRLLNLFARAVEEQPGKGLRQEIELVDSEGTSHPTVMGIAYLNTPEVEGRGYSLVITPVSDLKRMQQQLLLHAREVERANEELRQHDRAKDSFLSNVSHELRTPLTTIQGYIELFTESTLGDVTESQRNALAVMSRNANHLLTHINEMIEFSRIQIRGIQLINDLYDIGALAREAASAIHPSALEKDITVHVHVPEHPCYSWGDRAKLNQTLGILLNNAVKFSNKGGEITVRANVENEQDVTFVVSDTGIGISREHQDKIFNRFFQVDSSKTRQHEGAGIGLAIARNIVNAHGGEIAVESEIGQGATFTVRLPGATFDMRVPEEERRLDTDKRILLIAESEECREALRALPPLAQSNILLAPNSYKVTRELQAGDVALVILNDAQADVAGEATLRVLRKQPATRDAPVIVLTNSGGDVVQRIAAEQTKVHFVFKPFAAETLMTKAHRVLSGAAVDVEKEAFEALYPQQQNKPFVLVLDNDPGFLEWVDMALRHLGIDSHCTASAAHGLETARMMRPDVVFIDADTPPTLGAVAIKQFKTDAATCDVPIYAMTGMSVDALQNKNGSEVTGVLRKPFPITEMTEIITKSVAQKTE